MQACLKKSFCLFLYLNQLFIVDFYESDTDEGKKILQLETLSDIVSPITKG